MKKLLLIVAAFICSIGVCNSQNYEVLYVEQLVSDSVYRFCQPPVSGVIIYGQEGCEFNRFYVDGQLFENDSIILDGGYYRISFNGCDYLSVSFWLELTSSDFFNPFPSPIVWKRVGESVTIGNQWTDWTWQWSNGETSPLIDVTEPGVYTVTVSDFCGSEAYSVEVCDNVEIYRAGVDLASGLNKPTWKTTPEQALYIQSVKAIRDGYFEVGIAPYDQGFIFDNIGSDNASRNYTLIGILEDGTECPIESYEIGTPHADYSPNANDPNKINMAWTKPFIEEGAPLSVAYFLICKYDPYTGEITIVDQLAPNNEIGSYSRDDFNGGYAALGVLFNEGKSEAEMKRNLESKLRKYAKGVTMSQNEFNDVAFGNMSQDIILAVGEHHVNSINVYPNPSDGVFTVEGTGNLRITNLLGQEILTKEINGPTTIELPTGVYFLLLNGAVRKVVVE